MQSTVFLCISMGLIACVDDASGRRRGGRRFFMDMLRALGDEKLRLPGYFEYFPGSRKNLPSDEKGDELFADFPEVHIPAHEEIFMAAVGIAEGIRIVLKNKDFAGQPFFAQAFFGNG